MSHNGRFWVVLKTLDEMGSVILVMDVNGSFECEIVSFVPDINFQTKQLSLPCNGCHLLFGFIMVDFLGGTENFGQIGITFTCIGF